MASMLVSSNSSWLLLVAHGMPYFSATSCATEILKSQIAHAVADGKYHAIVCA